MAMKSAFCCATLKTGTLVVGWLNLIVGLILFTLVTAVLVISVYMEGETKNEKLTAQINYVIFYAVVIAFIGISACLLYGTYKRRAGFLLLYLVTSIIGEIASAILFIYLITIGTCWLLLTTNTIFTILEMYFLCIIGSHYDELQSDMHRPIKSED